ncbi:MAG: hypothetical protein J3Q66DRAFT_393635 [Benniella sp.]|nr:MAG: hypothetical protein J3Q66DRAFT_393635 [Benniella sp.]
MHQYYLSNLAIPFTRGIAGFKDKPFHLRRNEVVPPISLQQKVFPFIERAYDSQGEAARQCWERERLEEMTTNKVDDLENVDLVEEIEIIKKHWFRVGISDESVDSDTLWTPGIAKKSFLKLLIWLRRVILQDAVAYIHLKGPVLRHDIFDSPDFKEFQGQLIRAMTREEQVLPTDIPPGPGPSIWAPRYVMPPVPVPIQSMSNVPFVSSSSVPQPSSSAPRTHGGGAASVAHPRFRPIPNES